MRRRGFLVSSILAILISLSVISSIPSVKAVQAPPIQWSKVYLSGYGLSVIQTKDGGYAIAGKSNGKFFLLKTNSDGDVQWNKTYGDGWAFSIVQTSDGGYALTGSGTLFNFVKTDSEGNMQWNKNYGNTNFQARSFIQTSDGGYALLAGASSTNIDLVFKVDANGNVQWNKTYNLSHMLFSIVEADDDGYIINGLYSEFETTGLGILIKIDSSGNVQWNKTGKYGFFLIKTEDGGYLHGGSSDSIGYLVKTDSQGNIQWSKSYKGESFAPYSWFNSIAQTPDGGYVVAGVVSDFYYPRGEKSFAWVVKTDERGNREWTGPTDIYPRATAVAIIVSEDGGYVFTGSIKGMVWLVKIAFPDTTSPTISILSPENKTYTVNNVPLTFTVDKSTSWIGYNLDGKANIITISRNKTLTGLSNGSHNLKVYATDLFGNTGSSVKVHFTIDTPPSISIVSPQNKIYTTPNVPLNFTVNEAVTWMGYSLNRKANVTITENTTLTGLYGGTHSLVVYAKDTAGNTGISETIYFSIKTFPTTWIVATIAIIAIGGAALLVYFTKVKKTTGKAEK